MKHYARRIYTKTAVGTLDSCDSDCEPLTKLRHVTHVSFANNTHGHNETYLGVWTGAQFYDYDYVASQAVDVPQNYPYEMILFSGEKIRVVVEEATTSDQLRTTIEYYYDDEEKV